jgi:hypothetical protein
MPFQWQSTEIVPARNLQHALSLNHGGFGGGGFHGEAAAVAAYCRTRSRMELQTERWQPGIAAGAAQAPPRLSFVGRRSRGDTVPSKTTPAT